METSKDFIAQGQAVLGIELGSTRIKAVLIGADYAPIASGGYSWENKLENGLWTYDLQTAEAGLQEAFRSLVENVNREYGVALETVRAIGISGMMHGYLPFDSQGSQLAPFRTWRNTVTEKASAILTEKFDFNIPQRWSISHLYQAILQKEEHVGQIAFITTLAGYIHWRLTGEKIVGISEGSGMFPVDSSTGDYDQDMLRIFSDTIAPEGYAWQVKDILPRIGRAGEEAGVLTAEGAKLLDPTGRLQAGIPLCPPEGDSGTGMVATNSVARNSGNISAGTSIFATIVLEKPLSRVYKDIDVLASPDGSAVAMIHCTNCTGDLDAWVQLFAQFHALSGGQMTKPQLYDLLYNTALEAEADGGGLLACNYYSGEHLTGIEQGRPFLIRTPESRFTLPNLMRTILFSSIATLKIGLDIITGQEGVVLAQLMGHGGLFQTKHVGQALVAGALNTPIAVMESAGEGGAWGIALLAAYGQDKKEAESLAEFLNSKVFIGLNSTCVQPAEAITQGFAAFMERYKEGLAIERLAVEKLPLEQGIG